MARHAIINQDNKVVNIVIWEGSEWLPPRDHIVMDVSNMDCHVGDSYDQANNTFIRQPQSQ
jgi:hypothetical protein